jgi:uncharacterized protein (TIGR02996 family)
MDTEAGLREGVWEEPHDDNPRLILADWLEENGDAEKARRGAFIRAQVELANLSEEDPRRPALERQERELYRGRAGLWRREVPRSVRAGAFERGFFTPSRQEDLATFLHRPDSWFRAAPLWHIFGFSGDWEANRRLWPRLGDVGQLWRLHPFRLRLRLTGTDVARLAGWPVLSRLRALDLGSNPVGNAGAAALASSSHLAALESLQLAWCEVGPAGAAALAQAKHLGRLRVLWLENNPVGDEGARALVASPHLAGLRSLDLFGCGLTPAGVVALAGEPGLRRLTRLDLRGNALDDAGAIALAESPHLRHLTQLILWLPQLGGGLGATERFNRRSGLVLSAPPAQPAGPGAGLTEQGLAILRKRFRVIERKLYRHR